MLEVTVLVVYLVGTEATDKIVFDYILVTNLIHWLLFIHKILFSSTCFEPQVIIFSRIQLYTCSIWYCHSLWEFLVACRYTAWVRIDCRGKVVSGCLKTPTNNLPPTHDSTHNIGIYHSWAQQNRNKVVQRFPVDERYGILESHLHILLSDA